jgi:hypothetical protein
LPSFLNKNINNNDNNNNNINMEMQNKTNTIVKKEEENKTKKNPDRASFFFKTNTEKKKNLDFSVANIDREKKTLIRNENKSLKLRTIHFKFNQGYSNAVKRTVTINEFL